MATNFAITRVAPFVAAVGEVPKALPRPLPGHRTYVNDVTTAMAEAKRGAGFGSSP
jgi:hypothetical protein